MRIKYLQQEIPEESKSKKVWVTILLLYSFPMVCLFVVMSLFKEEENKRWSLKKYLPRSILYSFICTFVIALVSTVGSGKKIELSEFAFDSTIKYQVLPSLRNFLNYSRESAIVFYSRSFSDNICDSTTEKHECVHHYNMNKLKRINTSPTGVVLSIASEAILILNSKEKNKETNAHALISYSIDWLNYLCSESSSFSDRYAYGVHIISGSIEMPLLMLVNDLIKSRFIYVSSNKIDIMVKAMKEKSSGRELASYSRDISYFKKTNCYLKNKKLGSYFSQ